MKQRETQKQKRQTREADLPFSGFYRANAEARALEPAYYSGEIFEACMPFGPRFVS
jgi:hypothetical protein